ncbi:MAG: ATP-binding protein [Rubrobacter sp.]|nr:ATP-binding protein [Rubrobacter sp.]
MDGPYRDLGSGFARLTGVEGARRGPSRISHVEDALAELLRNARDAGARNVLVASTLTRRRFRTLTVLDDGHGIPVPYSDLLFDPGVTTRHLDPVVDLSGRVAPHGAGLSLYHIKQAALAAEVLSPSSPTAIRATFDTEILPERALQSETRPSKSNLRSVLQTFAHNLPPERRTDAYYGPPARVLATLIYNHIIQSSGGARELEALSRRIGLAVSLRTVQRVLRGEVAPLGPVSSGEKRGVVRGTRGAVGGGGPVLTLGSEETAGIADILRRAARAGYLEIEDLKLESRPGEISLRARVYEPEEEYE